jgi:ribosome biogenesis GTPase A
VLDCVGLIVPSSDLTPVELVIRGSIPVDNVPNLWGAVDKILSRVSKQQVLETYKISTFENVKQFLELVAQRGGRIAKVTSTPISINIFIKFINIY